MFHRGYGDVEIVGPLFLLNGVAAAGAELLLIFGREKLYVLALAGLALLRRRPA